MYQPLDCIECKNDEKNLESALLKAISMSKELSKYDIDQIVFMADPSIYCALKDEINRCNMNNIRLYPLPDFFVDRYPDAKRKIFMVPKTMFEPEEPNVTYSILQKCLDDYTRDTEEIGNDDHYQYTEEELKRKIKHSKNPMERMRLQKELGYLSISNKPNKYTKKKRRK